MVALMEGGRYTSLLPLKKTIDVPTNKTNVYTAGHDGPIRGFLPWWLRTKSKIGFQILLKIIKKKLTPKADLTRVADLTTRIGPTARSGPCRSFSFGDQKVDYATTMSLRGPVKTLTARREAPSLMGRMGR